jgi:alpha-tubulin suppressor-like RCC1 family protein
MNDDPSALLISFGRGCELGDGLENNDCSVPRQVESIEGAAIVDISCGGKHILCLSKKGEV